MKSFFPQQHRASVRGDGSRKMFASFSDREVSLWASVSPVCGALSHGDDPEEDDR